MFEMEGRVLLTIIVAFILGCQGLRFTLDREKTSVGPARCAILLCVEERVANRTAAPAEQTGVYTSTGTISSLTVFRVNQAQPNDGGNTGRRTILAIVTSIRPNVTQVSDRTKTDGHLTPRQAALRLELGKREDCQADFVCEFSETDGQGQNRVASSHLLQRPVVNRGQEGEEMWTPALALQLFSLVQQLDMRIALLTQSVAKWEGKMNRLEDKLGHEINSFQQEADRNFRHLQSSTSAELDGFEHRLEDNIGQRFVSLKNDVLSGYDRVEESLRWAENRLVDNIDKNIKSCASGANKQDADRFEKGVLDSIDTKLLNISLHVADVKREMKSCNISNLSTTQDIFNRLEKNMSISSNTFHQETQTNVCNATQELNQRFLESVTMIQNSVKVEVQRLSSIVQRSAVNSPCSGRELFSQSNATTGIVTPEQPSKSYAPITCTRGMAANLLENSPPYVVVDNSKAALETWEAPYLCDVVTDGGGWIVIQRRTTGAVDFYRGWKAYKRGFGTLFSDFWLGNERIHQITNGAPYELRIDLEYNNSSAFASYEHFYLDSEAKNYTLHVEYYSGTAGNSLVYHNNQSFSTHDRDNDGHSYHCAESHRGAWWYKSCHQANLNAQWGRQNYKGPRWHTYSGKEPCTFTEMKIRKML